MGGDCVFFANAPIQGVLFGKTSLPQDATQATGRAPWLTIPETGGQGGQARRQMRQDVGRKEAQFRQAETCRSRKHKLAVQAQQLLAYQGHFFDRPTVEIQLKDGRRLGCQVGSQHERILIQRIMIDPDGQERIGSGHFLVTTDHIAPALYLDAAASMGELRRHIGWRGGQLVGFVRAGQRPHTGAIFGGPALATRT